MADQQTSGRKSNAAETPGEFTALGGKDAIKRTGDRARSKAGPDGGEAAAAGDTFKKRPQAS